VLEVVDPDVDVVVGVHRAVAVHVEAAVRVISGFQQRPVGGVDDAAAVEVGGTTGAGAEDEAEGHEDVGIVDEPAAVEVAAGDGDRDVVDLAEVEEVDLAVAADVGGVAAVKGQDRARGRAEQDEGANQAGKS